MNDDDSMYFDDSDRDVRCSECAGFATNEPHYGADCTCQYGSCSGCGLPYATAEQQRLAECSLCDAEAERDTPPQKPAPSRSPDEVLAERMKAKTVEVPAITDFWSVALGRMGARS